MAANSENEILLPDAIVLFQLPRRGLIRVSITSTRRTNQGNGPIETGGGDPVSAFNGR
jgi:hypothetical protein